MYFIIKNMELTFWDILGVDILGVDILRHFGKLTFWELTFWEVDILGVDILGCWHFGMLTFWEEPVCVCVCHWKRNIYTLNAYNCIQCLSSLIPGSAASLKAILFLYKLTSLLRSVRGQTGEIHPTLIDHMRAGTRRTIPTSPPKKKQRMNPTMVRVR